MYVCICNAVTDRDIQHAAENGVGSISELKMATGCATTCGQCTAVAKQILSECRTQAPRRPLIPAFAS